MQRVAANSWTKIKVHQHIGQSRIMYLKPFADELNYYFENGGRI